MGFAVSTSEALRLIDQGAVKVNQEKVESKEFDVAFDSKLLIQVGKKKIMYVTIKGE